MAKKQKMSITMSEKNKQALNLMKDYTADYYGKVSTSYLVEYMTEVIIHRILNDKTLFIDFKDEIKNELEKIGFSKDKFKEVTGQEFEKHLMYRKEIENNELVLEKQRERIEQHNQVYDEETAKLRKIENQINQKQQSVQTQSVQPQQKQKPKVMRGEKKRKKEELEKRQQDWARHIQVIKLVSTLGDEYERITINMYNSHYGTNEKYFDIDNEEQMERLPQFINDKSFDVILKKEQMLKHLKSKTDEINGSVITEISVKDRRKQQEFKQKMQKEKQERKTEIEELENKIGKNAERLEETLDENNNREVTMATENEDGYMEYEGLILSTDPIIRRHELYIKEIRNGSEGKIQLLSYIELKSGDSENRRLKENREILSEQIANAFREENEKINVLKGFLNRKITDEDMEVILDDTVMDMDMTQDEKEEKEKYDDEMILIIDIDKSKAYVTYDYI